MALFVNSISADLVPPIFDPHVGFALLRITGIEAKVAVPAIETGIVRAVVLETLRPATPPAGAAVSFPFAREADPSLRFFNRANTWNALTLEKDSRLLVAWTVTDAPSSMYALVAAAEQPANPAEATDVPELKEALAIQALPPASPERKARLSEALMAGKSILRRYSCAGVGPKKLVPRAEGAEMLRDAIKSPRTDPDDDLILADTLMDHPLFDADNGDDPPNGIVLTTLAQNMVEIDPAHAAPWMRYLYSRVMPELSDDPEDDWTKRRDLLRAVGLGKKPVADRLRLIIAAGEPDAELAGELLTAWEKARKD